MDTPNSVPNSVRTYNFTAINKSIDKALNRSNKSLWGWGMTRYLVVDKKTGLFDTKRNWPWTIRKNLQQRNQDAFKKFAEFSKNNEFDYEYSDVSKNHLETLLGLRKSKLIAPAKNCLLTLGAFKDGSSLKFKKGKVGSGIESSLNEPISIPKNDNNGSDIGPKNFNPIDIGSNKIQGALQNTESQKNNDNWTGIDLENDDREEKAQQGNNTSPKIPVQQTQNESIFIFTNKKDYNAVVNENIKQINGFNAYCHDLRQTVMVDLDKVKSKQDRINWYEAAYKDKIEAKENNFDESSAKKLKILLKKAPKPNDKKEFNVHNDDAANNLYENLEGIDELVEIRDEKLEKYKKLVPKNS